MLVWRQDVATKESTDTDTKFQSEETEWYIAPYRLDQHFDVQTGEIKPFWKLIFKGSILKGYIEEATLLGLCDNSPNIRKGLVDTVWDNGTKTCGWDAKVNQNISHSHTAGMRNYQKLLQDRYVSKICWSFITLHMLSIFNNFSHHNQVLSWGTHFS